MWLTKAYDYRHVVEPELEDRPSYSGVSPIVELGVGKNMVQAIRYWSKVFGLVDEEEQPTEFAHKLLNGGGWDAYLEDVGSLWLLHAELVLQNKATLYSLVFNRLLQRRQEFTSEEVVDFIEEALPDNKLNRSTLKKDFSVFCRNYHANFEAKDIEESFNGLLTELELLGKERKVGYSPEGKQQFQDVWVLQRSERTSLPPELVLYVILRTYSTDDKGALSVGFEQLWKGAFGPGNVFALSRIGLVEQLESLQELYPKEVRFSRQAGVEELQVTTDKTPVEYLDLYYG